ATVIGCGPSLLGGQLGQVEHAFEHTARALRPDSPAERRRKEGGGGPTGAALALQVLQFPLGLSPQIVGAGRPVGPQRAGGGSADADGTTSASLALADGLGPAPRAPVPRLRGR